MDAEQTRKFLRTLPHVEETMQWGANLVYWAGDKVIGGKMFVLINLDEEPKRDKPSPVASFYVGAERYSELLEIPGVMPAPYFARIHWVALIDWNAFRRTELQALLAEAHAKTLEKLPRRTRDVLLLPKQAREKAIAQRRSLLEETASKKASATPKAR